jgi:hypothetical protein
MNKTYTSKSIQKLHPEIYQELFSTSDCVVSGNFSFNRFPGNIWTNENSVKVKQKIPLKCWIGLQPHWNEWLNIESSVFFNHSEEIFIAKDYHQLDVWIDDSLKLCFERFQKQVPIKWYSIKIISELERGYWFAMSGVMMMELCIGIALATKLVEPEDCSDCNHPIIKELYRLASRMRQVAKHNALSFNPFSTLYNEQEPVFYCYDTTQEFWYRYGSIPQLFPNSAVLDQFPFEVMLISSGKPTNTKYIKTINKSDSKLLDQVQQDFIQWFGDTLYDQLHGSEDLHDTLDHTAFVLGAELLHTFKLIYETGDNPSTNLALINQINDLWYLSRILEQHDIFYDEIQYALAQISDKKMIFGIMPMYSSKWWWTYLLVGNHPNLDQVAKQLCENLRNNYPDICLLYSSNCKEKVWWVICHQLMSDWVYSAHVDKYDLIYRDNQWNNAIGSMDELMKQFARDTLIVDTINNKIICKGVKLTSKELHSQITTVEVLRWLLAGENRTIENGELAPSSLTKQQNQMLGKIILPLQKVIQEHRGAKLPLECHGTLRHFTLSLGHTPVPIGIISSLIDSWQ